VPRLKKKYISTSTPPLGLRGLFLGELYLYHIGPFKAMKLTSDSDVVSLELACEIIGKFVALSVWLRK